MPLTTIRLAKEAEQTYQPLMLVAVTFEDGSVLRLCTHGLRTADGGFQYGGQDWFPRIMNQDLSATQLMSDSGIDGSPSANLQLADPDKFLWNNWFLDKPTKGATAVVTFVFWDVGTSTFSSDSKVVFSGLCGAVTDFTNESCTLPIRSRFDMASKQLPVVRIQKRCPWVFPQTVAQRQAAADDQSSIYFECGYSPDATGGNARGNYQSGTTPFSVCDFTAEACRARGMYVEDSSSRQTGRFGGVSWSNPQSTVSRPLGGKWEEVQNNGNEAKFGDFVPLVYGTQRVKPLVLNVLADGNVTKMEVLLCYGQISEIYEVVVNDQYVPHVDDDALFMTNIKQGGNNITGFWRTVNDGRRDGAPNDDALYDQLGDPYGSLAVVEISVPRAVAAAGSIPVVEVYFRGPKIRVYSDATTWSMEFTESPAWVVMDILHWAGVRYEDMDIQSFVDLHAKHLRSIDVVDQHGNATIQTAYTMGLTLRTRKSAAEVLRGIRIANDFAIVPNYKASGKLAVIQEETLAEQQPSDDLDSNFHDPVASLLLDGTVADGYVKYSFDERHYVVNSGKTTFKMSVKGESPGNKLSISFQNKFDRNLDDSLTVLDAEDLIRTGSETPGSVSIEGINNFNQGYRVLNRILAKATRGNPRLSLDGSSIGDTGGSLVVEFETTFRCHHLAVSDIVQITNQAWGLDAVLFRVVKIQPKTNFETVVVTCAWHNDLWHLDAFGQSNQPLFRPAFRNRLARPSFSWSPFQEQPQLLGDDALYEESDWSFSIEPTFEEAADKTSRMLYVVRGRTPQNTWPSSPEPPFVDLQGSSDTTGGNIPGGVTYFVAVCPKLSIGAFDADVRLGAPSKVCTIHVPAGTDTNVLTVTGLVWSSGTLGYAAFCGTHRDKLTLWDWDDTTPSEINLDTFEKNTAGVPDPEFDRHVFRTKRVLVPGNVLVKVVDSTATTLQVALLDDTTPSFTTDQFEDHVLSLMGMVDHDRLVVLNCLITANTSDVLTVANFDPTGMARWSGDVGVKPGDVFCIRAKTTVGSDGDGHYVEDVEWDNDSRPGGFEVDELRGNLLRCVAGVARNSVHKIKWNTADRIYIEGSWTVTPGAGDIFVVEEPTWRTEAKSDPITNDAFMSETAHTILADNVANTVTLISTSTLDGGGNQSTGAFDPVREVFNYGDGGALGFVGAIYMNMESTIAIGPDVAPQTFLNETARAKAVRATLKTAPSGGPVELDIKVDGVLWMSLTIPDGDLEVEATPAELAAATDIGAGLNVSLDVTSVPVTFPGADLAVIIFV